MKRTLRRIVLHKGKRTSRETALLKRQNYEDNSAAIKASERSQYWNDPLCPID